jgi:hypothetical protein
MNSKSRIYVTLSTSLQILNWNLAYFMAIQVFMFLYLSCLVGICFISLVYILSALSNFFSRRSRSICCILHAKTDRSISCGNTLHSSPLNQCCGSARNQVFICKFLSISMLLDPVRIQASQMNADPCGSGSTTIR